MTPEEFNHYAQEELGVFLSRAFSIINPGTDYEHNWHIDCISEHLMAAERGEIKRLIINIPPRTLKTSLVSIMFPAWVLARQPSARFIATAFKFERAVAMSLQCRQILEDSWYKAAFPKTVIDAAQAQKHNFNTTAKGKYYSSAILSVTGEGGDYIICDDPLAPDDAVSETVRNWTNDTIRNTLFSRFNDARTGRFILVMQRLHEDDPTGNLLRDGGYHLLKLPAEAQSDVKIVLGKQSWNMKTGELLFPSRLSVDVLEQRKRDMSAYHYAGQYLQEPVPAGGGEFKDSWINWYEPGAMNAAKMNIAILCDPAGGEDVQKKKKKLSDYTAFVVIGLGQDNNYYLLDMLRDRLNPTDRVNMLVALHKKWNDLTGKPPKVGYEKYGMMTDTHYIREKQRLESYNFPLIELGGAVMKEERIRRLIPDMQCGRWYFPKFLLYVDEEGRQIDLVKELIYSEMATFPKSRYDDCLDALSRIYDENLQMVFPRQVTKKPAVIETGSTSSWMDF